MVGVFHERAPEIIGKPYVVLGTIDESVWRRAMAEETSPDETIANLHDFAECWHFEPATP